MVERKAGGLRDDKQLGALEPQEVIKTLGTSSL